MLKKITFVIPLYNEAPTLAALAQGITEHVGAHPFRILFVDDGSTDDSWEVLQGLRQEDPRIELMRLRRNCGKTAALEAAFAVAKGDILITMDADLQDDPAEIPRMLAKLDEGYDLVCGWKKKRHDPWHKTLPSRAWNKRIAHQFSLPLHDVNTGFKAMGMEVAKSLRLWSDMHRLIPVFASYLGFKVTEIPVRHHPRKFGKSKYGFSRIQKGEVDVQSANFILKNQDALLYRAHKTLVRWSTVLVIVNSVLLSLGILFTEIPVGLGLIFVVFFFNMVIYQLYTFYNQNKLAELMLYRMPPPDPKRFVEIYEETPWEEEVTGS
ncbi:MAG: glycosyltransferase family 2 protein [Candidatus Hydrogenedens sp.]|nr:glycosyltransferase family 2 protein [Candidatus Hydrogenedens sp.]